MGILQLINIVLCWLFFGFLTAFIARRKGRHPLLWFWVGFALAFLGLLLVIIMPKIKTSSSPALAKSLPPKLQRSDAWLKMWYYLDDMHQQRGPIEFPDLIQTWKGKTLSEKTFIWGEGMGEWKRLSELPDLVKEMQYHVVD